MKRTNEISLKYVMLAGGLILTVILIGLLFFIQKNNTNTINNYNNQVTNKYSEFDEPEKSSYDGVSVNGSVVCDVILKMAEDSSTTVQVITKQNIADKSAGKTYSDSSIVATNTDANYINPNASFTGKVVRNENGIITKIVFTQE